MASVNGFAAVMTAIETRLSEALNLEFTSPVTPVTPVPSVSWRSVTNLPGGTTGNSTVSTLALVPWRLAPDSLGRTRRLPPVRNGADPLTQPARRAVPELPLELHFLVISAGDSADDQVLAHAIALRTLARMPMVTAADVGADDVSGGDTTWGSTEVARIESVDLSAEELARIWDALPGHAALTSMFVVRPIRIALDPLPDAAPVVTRVFHTTDDVEGGSR